MAWIERHWQGVTPVSAFLSPLSLLYRAASRLRRAATRPVRLAVPVVVVGNISVGGTGKTPLTLWLAGFLAANERRPGIVCSGYGGRAREARRVRPDSDPFTDGDEAVLLARRAGRPVWAGADRVAAARGLLAEHPECDILLCDDGLQHYALARDFEICVVDGARGFGNGWLLPAGPLREPPSRIASVGAVVVHSPRGDALHPSIGRIPAGPPRFGMALEGREFHNLRDARQRADARHFAGRRVHAVAGIGDPERFFRHLRALRIDCAEHRFPDHHAYTASDLAFADAEAVLMTEKDAVKCAGFAGGNHWFLPVEAVPDPGLGEMVLRGLASSSHGS
jgi:tetraacyldisaccharide 4'-kinase